MSNIEQKVRLFNIAHTLALGQVSQAMKAKDAGISERLAISIRKQIALATTDDPVEIAVRALSELKGLRR
jgi:hypothetical protein